jgi:hypothetical protein
MLPPEGFTALPQSSASTDTKVVKLLGVHIAERATLAIAVRPDVKDHAGDLSESCHLLNLLTGG